MFDKILTNENAFKINHPKLMEITHSFLQHYTENKMNLLELVHNSENEIIEEEEEDWKTDDEY